MIRQISLKRMANDWLPAVVIMTVVFIFSSIPSYEMPNFQSWDTVVKKGAHMLGYALLGLALLRGTKQGIKFAPSAGMAQGLAPSLVQVLALTVLYAMTDEFHQSFVLGRHARWTDVGIDAIGASIGLLAWIRFGVVQRAVQYRQR